MRFSSWSGIVPNSSSSKNTACTSTAFPPCRFIQLETSMSADLLYPEPSNATTMFSYILFSLYVALSATNSGEGPSGELVLSVYILVGTSTLPEYQTYSEAGH